jgi:tetratricopeptide (TPR) repeat protein
LSKIGLAYFALEQLDKAMEALEKALDIRKTYQKSGNLEVAKLQNNIAAIHYQKGDKKMALKKYKEALEIMKKLIEGPVRRESIMYDTSVILSNMGKIYLERKNYDMAYHMIEEALMVS